MSDQNGKEPAEAERRQGDRRRNASLDFGIADRRKSERRGRGPREPSARSLVTGLRRDKPT